ncbi:MAG: S41 family peptidase [Ignavibacteria bacterium]|nr:S41 family peptidase [Bacteroidota bacterium]MSQ45781.1 S41 family peptidase [Ignavibacteria bacterium]
MKKTLKRILVAFIILIAFGLGTQYNILISSDNIYEAFGKFRDVLIQADKYYVDDVDSKKLTDSAIEGMLNSLDPHSIYIKADQLKKVNEDFKGKFEGIGVEFAIMNDTITVVQPVGGGPSALVGILSNDKIVKIDGKTSVGFVNDQVMKSLKGPKGTKVAVSIFRAGVKELIDFEIIRDVIPLYSVDVHLMLNKEVGYISVSRFSETTTDEMISALNDLKSKGLKQLILDLRFNPGGFLDQAVKMSDLFLDGGKDFKRKIVYTKSRKTDFDEEYFAETNSDFEKTPIVILISNNSASASEIVSGAIQDWDRGLIVGETSFGKGLVQRQFPLSDGSAFRLTIARYYTPTGRLIQRPYDSGKEKYQKEAFERQEVEGDNIEHKNDKADSTKSVYYTLREKRKIYGGGGITPDFVVKSSSSTEYTVSLLRKNIFYEFVAKYLTEKPLSDNLKSTLENFNKSFNFSDEEMNEFTKYANDKGVKTNSEQYEKDKNYIKGRLKAHIARNYFGNVGWYKVILEYDNQLQKAVNLLPEASKIAKLN